MKAIVVTVIAVLVSASAALSEEPTAFDIPLDRDREVEIALSAAPEHLRADAGVHVLGAKGYRRFKESKNGFNCLVERDGPRTLAPICFDAEGSKTILIAQFRRAELVLSGKRLDEAAETIESEYASGKLKAPSRVGVAYMLSKEFCEVDPITGETKSVYPPHVMFYAPYRTNAELGLTKEQIGSPDHPWILGEGTPSAYIIVVPR